MPARVEAVAFGDDGAISTVFADVTQAESERAAAAQGPTIEAMD